MLRQGDTALVLIDVQGRLAEIVWESDTLLTQLEKLLQGLKVLGVPIVWNEQYPQGLGATHPRLRRLLQETGKPISKRTFSCCGQTAFLEQVQGKKQLLVAGIETHICVYQTVADLLRRGHYVEVVTDAVSSRLPSNRDLAIRKMETLGAAVTSVEMCLFELLGTSEGSLFKQIAKIIR